MSMRGAAKALLMLSAALMLGAGAGAGEAPSISDLREGPVKNGLAPLSVLISSNGEPFAPTIWYRAGTAGPFTAAGLLRAGDRWEGLVPLARFNYYLEAYDHAAQSAARLGSSQAPLPFPAPKAAGQGLKVAVLELESGLSAEDAKTVDRVYFGDKVRGALRQVLPAATMMTRENVQQLLAASGKTLEQCEGSCAVETGRLLGADLIVSGRMSRVGKRFTLSLRLHRASDGTLLEDASASGPSLEKIDDATDAAVARLAAAAKGIQ
jgi:hypothetical protein